MNQFQAVVLLNSMDVLIVGAGLAGLSAARKLKRRGLDVRVLEAVEEIGGRTKTEILNGTVIELGAEFVSPRHKRVLELVEEFDLQLERSGWDAGSLWNAKQIHWRLDEDRKTGWLPPLSPGDYSRIIKLVWNLRRMTNLVPPESPWEGEAARQYDQLTVDQWLNDQNARGRVRALVEAIIGSLIGAEMNRVSLLELLALISRSGGLYHSMDTLKYRLPEGTRQLAEGLSEKLGTEVHRGERVTSIRQNELVEVKTASGRTYTARRAIVAVGLSVLEDVNFEPPLPGSVTSMVNDLDFGRLTKINVRTDTELNGRIGFGGRPVSVALGRGSLGIGFAFGEHAGAEDDDLIRDVLDALAPDGEIRPRNASVKKWEECPYTRGSYVVFEPGNLTEHGEALNQPHDRVYFAGSGRASWFNTMEGALESGRNVGTSVMESLM